MDERFAGTGRRVGALLFLFATAGAAQAQATRTWVTGSGDDVNPCSYTAPCKTFAGAISKTAAGGQISVKEPGGFGAVTITKSITIDGFGNGGSMLSSGTNGVMVNIASASASSRVVLRGLTIDGAGSTLGTNGVRVVGAASVVIEESAIQNLSGSAISVVPAAGAPAAHVLVRAVSIDHAPTGITVDGANASAVVELEDVTMAHGTNGVRVLGGGTVIGRDVRVADFTTAAFEADGSTGAAELILERSTASSSGTGVMAHGAGAIATLAECSVVANGTGIAATSGAQVQSFGNNRIHGNADNGAPTAELGEQ